MDIWAAQARELHRAAQQAAELAAQHRAQRDALIRRLRSEDPERWTYRALSRAIGPGPEMIAHIVKSR